jgi:hypothetical protein
MIDLIHAAERMSDDVIRWMDSTAEGTPENETWHQWFRDLYDIKVALIAAYNRDRDPAHRYKREQKDTGGIARSSGE